MELISVEFVGGALKWWIRRHVRPTRPKGEQINRSVGVGFGTCVLVHEHFTASTDGLPQGHQDEASYSLTARRCRIKERQMKGE